VLVIADAGADAAFVAADLLSQAEHGPDSQVILLSDDAALLAAVANEVECPGGATSAARDRGRGPGTRTPDPVRGHR
jgi:histidinol dehydrogenase